ncbi:putative serine/threonine-protein kinase-like protein CCR3 [Lolium perenne]|uniref:putative serine/threonine-protein kinase-like protein CCR3 n=1 Tax=Lolium perenne TaxID=4522 RepID=UPI0021F5B4C8|nr:putative serine/threonine-protein kinase-like protein CCR3 [Lolium perenne]XP_051199883.1 putative serine/threonine-protein kinase-like protein CCR3 [Lolium perenne]XP_051199884.1 putative serine/threonine-protein kinase-like protein CCR3 [Lolium perenne]
MALWTGLGQAATVAQLVGADVGGLISMIMQAALTARQNRKECEQLARRVLMIAQLLPHVQDPEAAQQLAGLGDTLRDAHELVVSSQGRSAAYQFVMAGRQAERFKEVQSKIDFYLILFPVISHIGITRRLERIYNVLVQDDSTRADPSSQLPLSSQLQDSTEVTQEEVVPHGTQEFTLAEIMAYTNKFSCDNLISEGSHGNVYRGRLHDGREVAVKRMVNMQLTNLHEEFDTELAILSGLQHKHIIRLLGSCVTLSKDKRLQATTLKRKKGLLKRWRKEPEESEEPEVLERLIVYEYMENGTLFNHLHSDHGSSDLSHVTLSWKMRINVLLGVSRAMEHLHCHANPPIIHRDIKSANILFDANWVPHLSDFGLSVAWDIASDESDMEVSGIAGTYGYIAPEHIMNGRLSLASDVYSLGMVMLEVLTGKKAYSEEVTFADLPTVPCHLDMRPVPEPTPWQLQALKRVAWTARCCVKLDAKDRMAISEVVANLEKAHELICRDEPGSVDEPDLFDELPDSPRASSVSSEGYRSDLEPEVLEEGR